MNKIGWYLKRLQVMNRAEIVWRFGKGFRLYYLSLLWKYGKTSKLSGTVDLSDSVFCSANKTVLPELEWDYHLTPVEEQQLIDGKYDALGYAWQWKAHSPCWHLAPDSGNLWPLKFFGYVSYRQGNGVGDARVVWEASRLQQLVSLALMANQTTGENRDKAILLIEDELMSWDKFNPPLSGIHYVSSMECALRVISICYAFDLVRSLLTRKKEVSQAVLNIVGSHAYLIQNHISLFSSAGNHTIAECAGLIYIGMLFPEFKQAKKWKKKGLSIFAKEIDRQILNDGGGIEQAFWYLLFITDLTGLVVKLLEHNNEPSEAIAAAYIRAKGFLSYFARSPDGLPEIGDSDNGYALSSFLRLSFDSHEHFNKVINTFPDAGYSLIDSRQDVNTQIIFDYGTLGMAPSYGHGHADALSILLSLNQQELFVDSGTYTYTGEQKYRAYFRSTKAHNTVSIDGMDQAKQETPFLWSQAFNASLIKKEIDAMGVVRLLARHDGYGKLGVVHWRGISYSPEGRVFIWDYLEGNTEHTAELHWHIANDVIQKPEGFVVPMKGRDVLLNASGGDISLCNGEYDPLIGWRSQKYGIKHAINTLRVVQKGRLPMTFSTCVQFDINHIISFSRENEIAIFKEWM